MAALGLLLALLLPPPPAPACGLRRWALGAPGGCLGAARGCGGRCESGAFPARAAVRAATGERHRVTALGTCCGAARATRVRVRLQCPGGGHRHVTVMAATACHCDSCHRGRY